MEPVPVTPAESAPEFFSDLEPVGSPVFWLSRAIDYALIAAAASRMRSAVHASRTSAAASMRWDVFNLATFAGEGEADRCWAYYCGARS